VFRHGRLKWTGRAPLRFGGFLAFSVGLELTQRDRRRSLALPQLCDLPLRLCLLALQLHSKIGCPPFGSGGALSNGRKFDLDLLVLARPGGSRVAV